MHLAIYPAVSTPLIAYDIQHHQAQHAELVPRRQDIGSTSARMDRTQPPPSCELVSSKTSARGSLKPWCTALIGMCLSFPEEQSDPSPFDRCNQVAPHRCHHTEPAAISGPSQMIEPGLHVKVGHMSSRDVYDHAPSHRRHQFGVAAATKDQHH